MINKSIYYTVADTVIGAITDGVAVSSTNTYYSKPMIGENATGLSLQLEWSGTPAGVLTFWESDKPFPDLTSDTDWVQDTSFTPVNPAGSAGKFHADGFQKRSKWKRVKYVNASGSGTLKGWYTNEGI